MLRQINIKTMDTTDGWLIITNLYEKILVDDEHWHFFDEEEEGFFLRYSPEFEHHIVNHLNSHAIDHELVGDWVDDHPVVRLHREFYTKAFHLSALFALEVIRKEASSISSLRLRTLVDRVIHSLFNNLSGLTHEIKNPHINDGYFEASVLSDVAIARAFHSGVRHHYLKTKDISNDVKETSGESTD